MSDFQFSTHPQRSSELSPIHPFTNPKVYRENFPPFDELFCNTRYSSGNDVISYRGDGREHDENISESCDDNHSQSGRKKRLAEPFLRTDHRELLISSDIELVAHLRRKNFGPLPDNWEAILDDSAALAVRYLQDGVLQSNYCGDYVSFPLAERLRLEKEALTVKEYELTRYWESKAVDDETESSSEIANHLHTEIVLTNTRRGHNDKGLLCFEEPENVDPEVLSSIGVSSRIRDRHPGPFISADCLSPQPRSVPQNATHANAAAGTTPSRLTPKNLMNERFVASPNSLDETVESFCEGSLWNYSPIVKSPFDSLQQHLSPDDLSEQRTIENKILPTNIEAENPFHDNGEFPCFRRFQLSITPRSRKVENKHVQLEESSYHAQGPEASGSSLKLPSSSDYHKEKKDPVCLLRAGTADFAAVSPALSPVQVENSTPSQLHESSPFFTSFSPDLTVPYSVSSSNSSKSIFSSTKKTSKSSKISGKKLGRLSHVAYDKIVSSARKSTIDAESVKVDELAGIMKELSFPSSIPHPIRNPVETRILTSTTTPIPHFTNSNTYSSSSSTGNISMLQACDPAYDKSTPSFSSFPASESNGRLKFGEERNSKIKLKSTWKEGQLNHPPVSFSAHGSNSCLITPSLGAWSKQEVKFGGSMETEKMKSLGSTMFGTHGLVDTISSSHVQKPSQFNRKLNSQWPFTDTARNLTNLLDDAD